ncbi:hypothetical protein LEP1GSC017_3964 [Leptospira meyeri serovar Hardjo str. Went 5]|nr:hypothetical protein LEP1GSC017_3964 [Leptospira meyeri serovar Hardjo str. Went 5]
MKILENSIFTDFGKFIRYLSPSIIMITEIIIYKFTFNGNVSFKFFSEDSVNNLLMLTTFLFSSIFFSFLYQASRIGRIDYREFLLDKKIRKSIPKKLIKENSFAVISALWYSNLKLNKHIEGASIRSQELSNNLHGSGTSLLTNVFGYILFLIYIFQCEYKTYPANLWLPFIIFLFLFLLHFLHFCKIKSDLIIFVKTSVKISNL